MQFKIFIICLACGVLSGIVYDALYIIRRAACGAAKAKRTLKDKVVTAVCDVIYAAALSASFIFCSVFFSFPDVRLYMLASCLLGAALYIKSFHIMVAFLINKLYNRTTKVVKSFKSAQKPRRFGKSER